MRSPVLVAVCGLLLIVCVPLSGCQNGSMQGVFGKSAMDLLSPFLKDAANSYINNLKVVATELAGVRSLTDAVAVAPRIEPAAKDVRTAYNTLAAATPQERKLLWEAFGPKLDSANSEFVSQAARIEGESLWGRVLSAGLDQVKLFSK